MIDGYQDTFVEILDSAVFQISTMKPSEWAEKHRWLTSDVSNIAGLYSYKNAPYIREMADFFAADHPGRKGACMKGGQLGGSTGIFQNVIGWIIAESPCPVVYLAGHEGVFSGAVAKVDLMIDNSGLRGKIRPTAKKKRNSKSGDTDYLKEFAGGSLRMDITNHKSIRDWTVKIGLFDDYDSMVGDSKQSGSTQALLEQRGSTYKDTMKFFWNSTPELKETSNIYKVYLQGDQRKLNIPCPCCNEFIVLHWSIKSEIPGETAGITWKLDDSGDLLAGSVGYVCQKCGGFFNDWQKTEVLQVGVWVPTVKPAEPGFYSWHLPSLYAPVYMFGWVEYVRQYLRANPPGGVRDEKLHQTFVNLVLAEPYEKETVVVSSLQIQGNRRPYKVGVVPEALSVSDGNGRIVFLTLSADVNGKIDDARLDYEVVAWPEGGQAYAITHGSIGTFVPKEGIPDPNRVKMSYRHDVSNSVWPIFDKILDNVFQSDNGNQHRIGFSVIDCGYLDRYVSSYVNKVGQNRWIVMVKGTPESNYISIENRRKFFAKSQNIKNLFLVESNLVKDVVTSQMALEWDWKNGEAQTSGFMNYPEIGADGKFSRENYFSHFEAEEKIFYNGKFTWKKKHDHLQNHLFDCRCYNEVARDIFVMKILESFKMQPLDWASFVVLLRKN